MWTSWSSATREQLLVSGDALAEVGARAVVALADDERPARILHGLAAPGLGHRVSRRLGRRAARGDDGGRPGLHRAPGRACPRVCCRCGPRPRKGWARRPLEPLTPREREVLELLAHGLSNRQIAERLGISEHTAKFHVAAISGKLGAASRTEAVSRGVRRGLITL